ncbi:uncharacterized protein LOC128881906 isoform X2 [Hylaeus volcanicus]|uniref:uncharacterized protein LOC128881906 isoform X2 n=1 Tax=Hylaeus volcanicus TaxID=313075 RepID=UPI0023B7D285|nr:uncharacterized protein LOC128881906 isoform X2 [Hylaeus volcanicus]
MVLGRRISLRESFMEILTRRSQILSRDRSNLLTDPRDRTEKERKYILQLFNKFRAFRKYPDHLRESLTGTCMYQYLRPDRVIVRQGRQADNLYFVIQGEVSISRIVTDRWTGESKEVDMGVLTAGDIFGEIALLHTVPRNATVTSRTTVDLLFVPRDKFDETLRCYLMEEWDVLQDALVHFNYFKSWDAEAIRECCILSRMKDFQPDEVLLGDCKGMVNYVHFVLDGECRLIEHIVVREQFSADKVHYELYDPKDYLAKKKTKKASEKTKMAEEKLKKSDSKYDDAQASILDDDDSRQSSINYSRIALPSRPDRQMDFERASIITTTLLDVINQWHKVTDVAEMLMREPSSVSQQCYPENVRTIFMQICTFNRGACFGLGENMHNRRIVSTTHVRCFLIPRYFLNEHNRANIWERVKLFMDSKYPTREQLFREFVKNRRWLKYKEDLVSGIGKRGRRIRSNVTMHDVPYAIRIVNDVGV